jgi:dienelactone hydrolase
MFEQAHKTGNLAGCEIHHSGKVQVISEKGHSAKATLLHAVQARQNRVVGLTPNVRVFTYGRRLLHRATCQTLIFFLTLAILSGCAGGAGLTSLARSQTPEKTRAAFLKLIRRPTVPLASVVKDLPPVGDLSQEHFTFAAEVGQRVPGILLKNAKFTGRRPVVIILHGTGGNKEGMRGLLTPYAERGYVAVAIDGRYHGERTKAGGGSAEYSEALLRTYRTGKEYPFLYDTVWDIMRLLDYLETRQDVDARRIGLMGISKGGMETYLAAAADSRIAVAVPCIGVQSFRWALDNQAWKYRVETFQAAINGAAKDDGVAAVNADFVRKFYDRVVPGIYGQFDGPAMLPLIAPRPLLVINGDSDARTPVPGVQECAAAASNAYRRAQAEDKFVLHLQEKTGHTVNATARQAAIDWFVKWLKP